MSEYGVDPADVSIDAIIIRATLTTYQVPAFTNCFNATNKWVGAKIAGHLKIPPNKLNEPDALLVEAGIKRRFVTVKMATGYKTNYGEWSLDFELRNVALLLKAPQPEVQFNDTAVDFEV